MSPFFSIVIPTLNEEKAIPRLLEDIRRQKYKDYEVIIVDSRSADRTVEEAEKFRKYLPSLTILKGHKRNLCEQRNYGAAHAKGQYLVFNDADVQLYTSYLQELYNEIQTSGSLFLTTYQLPDMRGKMDILLAQISNYMLEVLPVINKQMAPEYNFVIRRDIFNKVGGFDRDATFSEAHELSIRIWDKTDIRVKIIRKNLLKWSFRRLRKDGRLNVTLKYATAAFYMLVFGKITDKNFAYQMGGDYFKDLSKINQESLKKGLKQAFQRIFGDLG